jgi:hypothetical protein
MLIESIATSTVNQTYLLDCRLPLQHDVVCASVVFNLPFWYSSNKDDIAYVRTKLTGEATRRRETPPTQSQITGDSTHQSTATRGRRRRRYRKKRNGYVDREWADPNQGVIIPTGDDTNTNAIHHKRNIRELAPTELSDEAQLNIACDEYVGDTVAAWSQNRDQPMTQVLEPPYEGSKALLRIGKLWIT